MATRGGVRYKADYIWETPDDGNIYEVIDGELYVTPPPVWGHQFSLGKLYIHVGGHVYDHGLGYVVTAPTGVVLDEGTGVEPDLLYISRERAHIISERGVEGAPDLVVEVLSPSTRNRDLGIKMQRYAAAGILHYWIVAPRDRTLTTYRLVEGGYEATGIYGTGDILRPELFPGLEIRIEDLWD
jgi:Uma2 family endonuclease